MGFTIVTPINTVFSHSLQAPPAQINEDIEKKIEVKDNPGVMLWDQLVSREFTTWQTMYTGHKFKKIYFEEKAEKMIQLRKH